MSLKLTRLRQGRHSDPRNQDANKDSARDNYNSNMQFHPGPSPSVIRYQRSPRNQQPVLPPGASQQTYMLSSDLSFNQDEHQQYRAYDQQLIPSGHPYYMPSCSSLLKPQKRMNQSCIKQEHGNFYRDQRYTKSGYLSPRANKPKMVCPGCFRCFDLNARMPLILGCSHLMCEDCLQSKKTPQGIQMECIECKADVSLKHKLRSDFIITDYFPVNYYIVGKLYCKRQSERRENPFQFKTEKPKKNLLKGLSLETTEQCKAIGCDNPATFYCRDCEEEYCNSCCDILHTTANSSKNHRVFSISIVQCTVHDGQPFEYYCNTCSSSCCTYCIIEEHKDHSFKHVTKLELADEEKFSELVENCDQMLRKLELTQKSVHAKISKQQVHHLSNGLEKKILKCFNEIHGKLQRIEANLLCEATSSANALLESLKEAEFQLQQSIASVKELLKVGNQLLKHKKLTAWQNVNVDFLMHRMINAGKLPCFLQMKELSTNEHRREDFEYIDFTRDLSKHFKVNSSPGNIFKLVNEEAFSNTITEDDPSDATSEALEIAIETNNKKLVNMNCRNQELPLTTRSGSDHENNDWLDISANIPTINFTLNSMEKVLVTHIVSPEKFYVQFVKHDMVIHQLHKEITRNVDQLYASYINNPIQDKLYLVKMNDIGHCWRRALVIKVIPERNECFVYYIDYGNSDTVSFNCMRTITNDLSNIVPFAFECKLYDIYEPPNAPWTDEIATLMAEMLFGANLSIIMRGSSLTGLEVDLIVYTLWEEFYLRRALLFTGRGVCSNDNDETVVEVEEPGQRSRDVYSIGPISRDSLVNLVHIENSITIYIRDHSYKDNYRSLSRSLSDYLNNPINNTAGKLYLPQVGNAVAFQVIDDEHSLTQWYRGLVLDVQNGTGYVTVQQVDTGRESVLNYNCLRYMPIQFLKHPKMARKVQLAHVTYCNEGENKSGIAFLERLKDVPLKVEQHNNKACDSEIILWEPFGTFDLCVNTQLVLNAGLRSTGFMSTMLERHQEEVTSLEPEQSLISKLMQLQQDTIYSTEDECEPADESTYLGQVPVKVVQVVSPDCIYLHMKNDETFLNDLKQFELKLQAYCNSIFVTRNSWKVGDYCAAYNRKLMNYSRVEIMQCLENNRFEVIGLDHRNVFQTDCETLAELSEEFFVTPPMALKVRLYGIKPMGEKWSLTSTDLLKDLLLEKNDIYMTTMKIKENAPDLSVMLWIKKSRHGTALERTKVCKRNVSKILSKSGLGILSKEFIASLESSRNSSIPESLVRDSAHTDDEVLFKRNSTLGRQNLNAPNDGFNWLPAKPITESCFQAIATYVDDTGNINFHYPEEMTILNEIEDVMFKTFQFVKPSLSSTWEIGNACTVKYHQNQKFYRGEIVGLNETEKELRICMIDYGNVEDCKYNEVWKEIRYTNIPRIAKTIRLAGFLEHKEYPLSVVDELHRLVVEKVLDMKVEKPEKSQSMSAWVNQGSIDVNEFVQRSFMIHTANRQKDTTKSIATTGSSSGCNDFVEDVIIEKVIYNSPKTISCEVPLALSAHNSVTSDDYQALNNIGYKYRDLPSTELFEAHIIDALSTNRIVFEVEHDLDPKFEDLQKDINARWIEQPVIMNLVEDQVCIARYSSDSTWYRAKIIALDGKNIVHFVDFGNAEELASPNIREIKSEWLAVPVTQYLAVLSDFKLGIEGHELFAKPVISHLESYLESKFLIKVTCNEPLSVKLFDPDTKKLAYQKLFDSKILQKVD